MDEDAFSGLRVVELAQWVFVPVAGALLAEHTESVLLEIGYTWDEISGLRDAGVLP